ncbi:MAG: hypothetical protein AB7S26_28285 [Sandaracinaceae bacterium]
MTAIRLAASVLVLALVASLAPTARAQEINPETGEVYEPQPNEPVESPPPVDTTSQNRQPTWYNGGPTGTRQETANVVDDERADGRSGGSHDDDDDDDDDDGLDDHMRVVGHLAVGFLGASTVPIGTPGAALPTVDTVTAPALGIRYWLGELLGLDVGIGIGYLGGTASTGTNSVPLDNAFALNIHAGLPLALFHAEHYKFLIIPEANFGFATGTSFGTTQDLDRGRNGLVFQIGGRLGTEIHFGFMDVPQLSLQASVGLYFEYSQASVGNNRAGSAMDQSISTYGLATSVQGEPWDIVLGALNALYYFE